MNEPTNEPVQPGGDLASAARDRGMEQLEGAKGRIAEGAERVAAAVERTADDMEGDGDAAISGFGRSVASLMRQLAGGLRERDVEQFADELGALARRNPAVFLAGSVALGFGVARFFKARAPQSSQGHEHAVQPSVDELSGERRDAGTSTHSRSEVDADEDLDLSSKPETERMESSGPVSSGDGDELAGTGGTSRGGNGS